MAQPPSPQPRDLPQVPDSVDPAIRGPLSRVIQEVQRLLEFRGDPIDAALTIRKAITRGLLDSAGRAVAGSVTYVNTFPTTTTGGGTTPDLTPPPTVSGLAIAAGFTQVIVEWDAPVYVQGHGNLQTNIYAVKKATTDPTLPTFGDAVLVYSAPGALSIASLPSELNTRWHVWAKFKTVDGVESTTAAGGINGVSDTTGQDILQLLEVLTGSITESQLYVDLGQEIDLIKELSEANNANAENTLRTLLAVQDVSDGTYAAILQEQSVRQDQTGALFAQWTVKLDVNGYVSGFGLASTSAGATPYSQFIVRADSFSIASPSGPGIAPTLPFIVRTTPTVIGGVAVPVGVYMEDAFIQNGSISNAKIGNLAVDDAKVASMSVAKLIAGSLAVGQYVQSTGYVAGTTGFRINGNGTAEFSSIVARGEIYASAGTFAGALVAATGTFSGALSAATGTFAGALSAATGTFAGALSAATGTFSGALSAATGTLGTLTIAAGGYIRAGQTAYNTGIGFYLGIDSGVPRFSMGNPAGAHVRWDGTDLFINTPRFENFTASIPAGDLTVTVPEGYATYGSRTVTVSGGAGPYSYAWVVTGNSLVYIESGAATATVTIAGNGPIATWTGQATCFVVDRNGRVTLASFNYSATHV